MSNPSPPASRLPAVSVVLPAYNRAGAIRAAIDSVLRQSFADFELIVVDDASTDGTRAAAEAVADPRVRVIAHAENRGAAAARNTGIDAARAPWVAFQDSDDEWLPLKLERQMARLAADPAFVAGYCGMLVLGSLDGPAADGRLRFAYVPRPDVTPVEGDITATLIRVSIVSTQTLVARRDRLREIGGFDPEMPALIDWECMLRLAPLGPVACVDEPLVLQRFSANSITRERVKRATARERAVAKHRPLLARHPKSFASLLYAVAGDQRAAGDHAAAARTLAEARTLDPGNLRLWGMSAYVAALPLLDRIGVPALPSRSH